MKRKITLITTIGLVFGFVVSNAQTQNANFTAGNIVVVRVNTNTDPANTNAVPVFLDEYNAAGVVVNTVALPKVTVGANRRFLVGGAATASSQGFSTLSPNGKYLAIAGHDIDEGAPQTNVVGGFQHISSPKVIAVISNDVSSPIINTSTAMTNLDNRDNRNAVVANNGLDIWFGGQAGGIQYTTLGSTTSTQISASPVALRPGGLGIFNGQLYSATNADPFRVAKVGTGLPTASTASTALSGIPFSGLGNNTPAEDVPNGIVLFDIDPNIPGNDLLYFVSELNNSTAGLGAGHLRKYVRTAESGDNWVFAGGISVTNNNSTAKIVANVLVQGLKALTGSLVSGVPTLYAANNNRIIKIADNSSHLADLNPTVTTLATAGAGTSFRGLTFAPSSTIITTLPVTLTSFKGKTEQNYVQLNWTTSSEKNNSHFEVLRSADGKKFSVIGKVSGNNNSDEVLTYEFKDNAPLVGRAYYRLNQIDYDGKNVLSEPITVNFGLSTTKDFSAYATSQSIEIKFHSASVSKGKVVIYDTAGQVITSKQIAITVGTNEVSLPANKIAKAKVYIALLDADGNVKSQKFIANN